MPKTIASSILTLVVLFGSELCQAATPNSDKCARSGPGYLRRQCAIELGGYCNPATGRVILRGPSAGVIKGQARLQDCVERKRAERRAI